MLLVLTLEPHSQALHNSTDIWQASVPIVPLQYPQPTIERTPAMQSCITTRCHCRYKETMTVWKKDNVPAQLQTRDHA